MYLPAGDVLLHYPGTAALCPRSITSSSKTHSTCERILHNLHTPLHLGSRYAQIAQPAPLTLLLPHVRETHVLAKSCLDSLCSLCLVRTFCSCQIVSHLAWTCHLPMFLWVHANVTPPPRGAGGKGAGGLPLLHLRFRASIDDPSTTSASPISPPPPIIYSREPQRPLGQMVFNCGEGGFH